jgi:hypothetical protein
MKKLILSLAMVAFMGVSLIACKNETKEETKTEEIAKVEYQCPMKCEGDKTYTDKDTKCPVCGMALKEVEHTEGHDDHGHDE